MLQTLTIPMNCNPGFNTFIVHLFVCFIFSRLTIYTQTLLLQAQAPKFPKPKDEGWFLILGDVENRELLALKRVPFVGGRGNQSLAFQTPETVSHSCLMAFHALNLRKPSRIFIYFLLSLGISSPLHQMGRCVFTLYILSNSYIGLDQQYDVRLDVIEASIDTQLNTEVLEEAEIPKARPGMSRLQVYPSRIV